MSSLHLDIEQFRRLMPSAQERVTSWLAAHGLARAIEFWTDGTNLAVKLYRVTDKDKVYLVNCKGRTRREDPHHRHDIHVPPDEMCVEGPHACGCEYPANCWNPSQEIRWIRVSSPCPLEESMTESSLYDRGMRLIDPW